MFHIALPSVVRPRNSGSGIRSTPAGMDTRLRNSGIIRPKNTAFDPCRRNHASVFSTSATFTSGSRPARASVRSRPSSAPTPYRASAPITEPAVVHSSTANKPIRPLLAAKPANGRITSLGTGGKRFSSAMARPAPGAPRASIRSLTHPGPASAPEAAVIVCAAIDVMPSTLGNRS
ncbi:hypothetical protein SALBM217S_04394 [Streptomyces griseoloalbus]